MLQFPVSPAVLQRLRLVQIRLKHRLVKRRRSRPGQYRKGFFLHPPDTLQIFLRLTHQIPHPWRVFQFLLRGNLISFLTLRKPFLRPRITGREIKQIQDQILDPLVCFSRRVTFDKIFKFRRLFRIAFFQNLLHHIRTEQTDFPVLRHPVSRIQIDHLKIILDHIRTESVDRIDLGMMKKGLLTLKMIVVRILLNGPLQRLSDSLPHLSGCRPGERHDQQLVHVDRLLRIHHPGKNPLYKNRRLSGTGCRTYQKVFPSQADHLLLFSGPFYSHVSTSSCIALINSKSSSVFSFRYWNPGSRWSNPQIPL